MVKPVILFRDDLSCQDELAEARKHFNVYRNRSQVPDNSLVIGRYSVLPFYKELEDDLNYRGSRLINSLREHQWIANFEYYEDLREFTPRSWDDTNFHRCEHPGPFVVKGKTNSKKQKFDTLMYAQTKRDAVKLASTLMQDMAIVEQGVVYREFVPLKVLEYGLCGLPYANEWRFFVYKTTILSKGFYWTGCEDRTGAILTDAAMDLVVKVMAVASKFCTFYVVDVAETASGSWILVELNDGQMSGLSECDPAELYGNLAKVVG